jgi:hypothetical protein
MKTLYLAVFAALLFVLAYAPAHAAIPAPTRTPAPTPQALTATAGAFDGSSLAITVLRVAGVFLAGVVALFLVRRGGRKVVR